jgi:mxaJ protein
MWHGLIRLVVAAVGVLAAANADAGARNLRVCADPNNLPYSNERGEGFENRIVTLLAADLRAEVDYTWWAQRRDFIRNTLKAGLCDLIAGVPTDMEMLATTRPYYRSGYVFMANGGHAAEVRSFDDPKLSELRIGVQMIGDDFSNTPPAHALSRRGIVDNVRGFMVYGDYADAAPGADIVDALERGDIDLAIVWGPQAGYFARRLGKPVSLTPVEPEAGGAALPMAFVISMGVRPRIRTCGATSTKRWFGTGKPSTPFWRNTVFPGSIRWRRTEAASACQRSTLSSASGRAPAPPAPTLTSGELFGVVPPRPVVPEVVPSLFSGPAMPGVPVVVEPEPCAPSSRERPAPVAARPASSDTA